MRGIWVAGVGAVAVVVVVAAAMWQPLIGLGVVVIVIGALLPRRMAVPVASAVVLGLMIVFPVQYLPSFGGLSRVVLYAAPAVTALALIRSGQRPHLGARLPAALLGAYLLLLSASTFLHLEIANPNLLWATFVPAVCISVLITASDPQQTRWTENFVVLSAAAESTYAVVEMVRGLAPVWPGTSDIVLASQILPGFTRSQGTLAQPLVLALLCIVAVALLLSRRHGTRRGMIIPGIIILTAGVVAAGSRSALALIAVLIAFSIGRRIWSVLTIAVGLGLLGVVSLAAGGFFSSYVWTNFLRGDSLSHRNGALSSIPGLIHEQSIAAVTLGNGYFSAPALFARGLLQRGNFYAIDNQLVTSIVETGILGLILLCVACCILFSRAGQYRMLIFTVVAFFFTFDLLSWPSAATLFAFGAALVIRQPKTHTTSSGGLEGQMSSAPIGRTVRSLT
jgi:hypothetical protein